MGCAAAILHSWITGKEASCDCGIKGDGETGGGCC